MFYYSYISTFSNLFKFNITRNIRNDDVVANHFITYNLIYVISNTSYQLELMISFFFAPTTSLPTYSVRSSKFPWETYERETPRFSFPLVVSIQARFIIIKKKRKIIEKKKKRRAAASTPFMMKKDTSKVEKRKIVKRKS